MKKILLALLASAASATALAQPYVGAAGGFAQQNYNCAGFSCDKSDVGYKFYGGVKFNRTFAGELAYTDFGKQTASLFGTTLAFHTTGFSVGAAGHFELAPKSWGIARIGLASNTVKASGPTLSNSESSTQPYLGFGLGYEVAPKLSLTGSFDWTRSEKYNETATATLLAFGLSYAF